MKIKKNLCFKAFSVLTLIMLFNFNNVLKAEPLSLLDAISLAFENNVEYNLYLRKEELALKADKYRKLPRVTLRYIPLNLYNGKIQEPYGNVTIGMDLVKRLNLGGELYLGGIKLDKVKSYFGLSYVLLGKDNYVNYVDDNMKTSLLASNRLVTELLQTSAQVNAEAMGLKIAKESLALINLKLRDSLLTKEAREQLLLNAFKQEMLIEDIEEGFTYTNKQLLRIIGQEEDIQLQISFWGKRFEKSPETKENLAHLYMANDYNYQNAQKALADIEKDIKDEKRTRGWGIDISSKVTFEPNWYLGLEINKNISSNKLILAGLELEKEKNEYGLEIAKEELDYNFQKMFKSIERAELDLDKSEEYLLSELKEYELVQNKYKAGLLSEYQLREKEKELLEIELHYFNAEMTYWQHVMQLLSRCGLNLQEALLELLEGR